MGGFVQQPTQESVLAMAQAFHCLPANFGLREGSVTRTKRNRGD